MCASFNDNSGIRIVSYYNSANASDGIDIITPYKKLSFLVRHIP